MGTEDVSAIISHLTPVAHFPNFYDSLGTVKEVFRKGTPETITDSTVKTLVEDLQLPLIFLTLLTRRYDTPAFVSKYNMYNIFSG
ncbi:hypothetical protein E4U36_006329 [Claviceps purpurea]|nr:hypothetical protein E4U36_006329 [Claviceps purpurea]